MSNVPRVGIPDQQHMLMLFLPLKNQTEQQEALIFAHALAGAHPNAPGDDRVAKGVHFAMFYFLEADGKPHRLPVPTFQTAPNKHLLIAQAFYDGDFASYIGAFTNEPTTAAALNGLLGLLDESGIVPDTDPTSAAAILAAGGVAQASAEFNCLLLRYDFGDPVLPGTSGAPTGMTADYGLVATFPGLTVGKILATSGYPNAQHTWPFPPPAKIDFQPTPRPQCPP
jgi:hypothetical protein